MLAEQEVGGRGSMVSTVQDYVSLTKPKIISLLLVTALGGMFLAEQGIPSGWLILVVLAGGSLASGGANALNHFLERHSDQKMTRTQKRPVASQRIVAWQAMVFGVGLNAVAFAVLAVWANLLSAALTLGATVFYVLVYTAYLKRRTPQNIVIGGAAGAVPPMVGWAAVTGGLDLEALYLFAIIFFWTPAHFWALALLIRNDYARAEIPMLPVVRGVKETSWNILLYSFLTVALTMAFFTTQAVDWLYLYIAAPLGAGFIYLAVKLWRSEQASRAKTAYLYSLLYLAGLFTAIMLDSTIAI